MVEDNYHNTRPYHAPLSMRFMVSSFSVCCVIAFSIGRIARFHLTPDGFVGFDGPSLQNQQRKTYGRNPEIALPTPLAKEGKVIPETIYTTRNFDTRGSATILSQWLKPDPSSTVPEPLNERLAALGESGTNNNSSAGMGEEEEEEEHLPAGQHLLVDIDNIDAAFLDSEEQLATAMVNLVDSSGLTLLSYHCHGLTPAGVSCAGVLLESHVAFHTWPAEGVITLDLFTCGSTSLLNSLKLIEDLFARPRLGQDEKVVSPTVLWAYKRRGFKDQISDSHNKPGSQRDTFAYPLGIHGLEYKEEVAAAEILPGKHAYIYDLIQRPYQSVDSYRKSLSLEGSYESRFPKHFRPNRLFYYDGVLKSSRLGEAASYESFVHPAMLAHADPKRILIVGAGAGGSLREVLKHKSVEQVTVLGVDRSLVEFARENLQDWNDCSDLEGSRIGNCFDDPRVDLKYEEDSLSLLTQYRTMAATFDVALVDFEFASDLAEKQQPTVLDSLMQSLSKGGVAAFHVSNDRLADLPSRKQKGSRAIRHKERQGNFVTALAASGFEATKEYNEMQPGFPEQRHYVVAFKDAEYAHHWFRNEAQVTREIHSRTVETNDGSTALLFFDGAKMTSYSKYSGDTTGADCASGRHRPPWCEKVGSQNLHESNATNEDFTCQKSGSPALPGCSFAGYMGESRSSAGFVS